MHNDRQDHPQSIDGHVPLAAGDLLPSVVASFFAPFGSSHRLTVHDHRTRRRILAAN